MQIISDTQPNGKTGGNDLQARKAHIRANRKQRQRHELAAAVRGPGRRLWALALLLLMAALLAWALSGCSLLPTIKPGTPSPTSNKQPVTSSTASVVKPIRAEKTPGAAAGPKMTPAPTPTPAACEVTNTGGEVLNVRTGPGLGAEIVGALRPGQRVTVESWGDQWHKITAGDISGFVYATYCEGVH